MKMDEIQKRYPGEWVLIEYTTLDEQLNVVDGDVIAHAASKDEIYRELLKTSGKNVAVEYLGTIPEDLAVML